MKKYLIILAFFPLIASAKTLSVVTTTPSQITQLCQNAQDKSVETGIAYSCYIQKENGDATIYLPPNYITMAYYFEEGRFYFDAAPLKEIQKDFNESSSMDYYASTDKMLWSYALWKMSNDWGLIDTSITSVQVGFFEKYLTNN